jgi:hypothetical protein
MKLVKHTQEEIEIDLDLTQLEQMLNQLINFPAAPCWWKSTQNGISITINGKCNIGHE